MNNYDKLATPSLIKVFKDLNIDLKQFNKINNLKVVIFGFFGMNNIGDDVLLNQEIKQIESLKVPYQIVVPSENPEIVEKIFKVNSFKLNNFFTFVKNIKNSNIIIFGGGGLICATGTNGQLKTQLIDFLFDVYKCTLLFLLPKILSKKIIVFGIGAYSNISSIKKILYINSLKLADYISVRDEDSYIFLKNSLSDIKISYQKDLAFLIKTTKKNKTIKIKPKIGISLIPLSDDVINKHNVKSFSRLINSYGEKFEFIFFPFLTNKRMQNDLDIGQHIKNQLNDAQMLEITPYDLGAQGFYNLYGDLDYAFCTRFHSQVFAYKQKIPFLGISYDNKCKSFLSEINVKWIDINKIDYKFIEKNLITNTKYL